MFELLLLADTVDIFKENIPWWAQILSFLLGSGGVVWGLLKTLASNKKHQEVFEKSKVIELLQNDNKSKEERINKLEDQINKNMELFAKETTKLRKEIEDFWKNRIIELKTEHEIQMDKVINILKEVQNMDHDDEDS